MSTGEISVEEQYLQDEKVKKEVISDLLGWVQEQESIPDIGEKRAILFYQSCRYDLPSTKSAIKYYFEMTRSNPEFFKNTDPRQEKLLKIFKESFIGILPLTTPNGYKIFLMKGLNVDVKAFSLEENFKLVNMVNTLFINKHGMPPGLIGILDLKEVPFGCYTKCGIWTIKKILAFITRALPVHVVSIHCINAPRVFNKILAIVKFFAPSGTAERYQVHQDIQSLYKFVPKEIMPEEYGGNCGSMVKLQEENTRDLVNNAQIFLREEELIYGK